jgi:hypothetical protein
MIDTRDLIEERENTQQRILDDWNEKFEDNQLDDFSEIPTETEDSDVAMFLEYWEDELNEIQEINELEDEVGSEWEYGVTLIEEDDFEEYCEDFCNDVGYISRDTPQLILNNIDWKGIADDMKQDYSEVEFRGTTYLYR